MHEAPEFVCHETDEKEAIEPEKSATSRSRALCGLRRRWFFALLAVTVLLFTAAVVGGIVGGMRSRASLDSDTNPNLASVPSQTSTQAMSPSTTSASKPAATANSSKCRSAPAIRNSSSFRRDNRTNCGSICSNGLHWRHVYRGRKPQLRRPVQLHLPLRLLPARSLQLHIIWGADQAATHSAD